MGRPLKGRGSQKTCLIRDPYTTEVRSLLLWGGWEKRHYPRSLYFRVGDFFMEDMAAIEFPNAVRKESSIIKNYVYSLNSKGGYHE
jgi:hypothetical protein